jgi:hypothetical protein
LSREEHKQQGDSETCFIRLVFVFFVFLLVQSLGLVDLKNVSDERAAVM